jgi:hypothetical protein
MAKLALNDAMILAHDTNLRRMEFSESTRVHSHVTVWPWTNRPTGWLTLLLPVLPDVFPTLQRIDLGMDRLLSQYLATNQASGFNADWRTKAPHSVRASQTPQGFRIWRSRAVASPIMGQTCASFSPGSADRKC